MLDDLFELDALTKLGGQVLAAGFLVVFGVQLYFFPLPGGGQFSLDPAQAALLTVVIVVATVNAVNFVDGLDGLAAGVVGIGARRVLRLLLPARRPQRPVARRSTGGAARAPRWPAPAPGFLPHNFYPARLFMGDSGSMLIGLVLVGVAR